MCSVFCLCFATTFFYYRYHKRVNDLMLPRNVGQSCEMDSSLKLPCSR